MLRSENELADKLEATAFLFTDWDDLCVRLKTREITYSKISRCLCRILLSIPQEMLLAARDNDYTPYARILGFPEERVSPAVRP